MKCKYCHNNRFVTPQSCHRYIIVDENGAFLHPHPYYGEDSVPKSLRYAGSFECTICGAKYSSLDDNAVCENGPVEDWAACVDFYIDFLMEKSVSHTRATANGSAEEVTHIWRNKYYIVHTTELEGAAYVSVDLCPDPDMDARYLPRIEVPLHTAEGERDTIGKPLIQTTSFGTLSAKEYAKLQRAMNIARCCAEEIEREILVPLRKRMASEATKGGEVE